MIFINLEGKVNLDAALKKLKSKFNNQKIAKELSERRTYKKKCEVRRDQIKKARYIQSKKESEN